MTKEELLAMHPARQRMGDDIEWAKAVRHSLLSDPAVRIRFLEKGETEDTEDFKIRAAMCSYSSLCKRAIGKVLSVALGSEPRRDNLNPQLASFAERVTLDGCDLSELVMDASENAVWYRFSVALLDRKTIPEGERPITAEDDRRLGIDQPYFALYAPEDVLNWRFDSNKKLSFISLRNCLGAQNDGTIITEVRFVYKDRTELWHIIERQNGETVEHQTTALTPNFAAADCMPIAVCQPKPVNALMSDSPALEALQAELKAFRLESDISFGGYNTCHPMLKAWVHDDLGDIGVGANKYIKLMPANAAEQKEAENLEWMEVTGRSLEILREERNDARAAIKSALGVSVTASDDGRNAGVANSGVQVSYQFNVEEGPTLKQIAEMAERFEFDLLKISAIDMGIIQRAEDAAEVINIAYNKDDFGLESADRLLSRAQSARGIYGSESGVTKALLKRAARALVPNETQEFYAEVDAQIDASGAYEPPAPDFGFGA